MLSFTIALFLILPSSTNTFVILPNAARSLYSQTVFNRGIHSGNLVVHSTSSGSDSELATFLTSLELLQLQSTSTRKKQHDNIPFRDRKEVYRSSYSLEDISHSIESSKNLRLSLEQISSLCDSLGVLGISNIDLRSNVWNVLENHINLIQLSSSDTYRDRISDVSKDDIRIGNEKEIENENENENEKENTDTVPGSVQSDDVNIEGENNTMNSDQVSAANMVITDEKVSEMKEIRTNEEISEISELKEIRMFLRLLSGLIGMSVKWKILSPLTKDNLENILHNLLFKLKNPNYKSELFSLLISLGGLNISIKDLKKKTSLQLSESIVYATTGLQQNKSISDLLYSIGNMNFIFSDDFSSSQQYLMKKLIAKHFSRNIWEKNFYKGLQGLGSMGLKWSNSDVNLR